MAMSMSRPDPSSPGAVSTATFALSRRGFEQGEVRDFLRMVAAELARLQEREKYLERELRTARRSVPNAAVALDEEVVTRMLGEEAARILHTAREAASQIKTRSEEQAARLMREATDEAQRRREEAEVEAARRRQDASSDAEAELQMAKQQGREMVNEARAYRERVLSELARRRELARQQIEQLVHGRDRLLQAFERARVAAVDVMAELTPLGEPSEYVNLNPVTGPVPLMVPARQPVPAPAEEAPPAPAAELDTPEPEMIEPEMIEPEAAVAGEEALESIDDEFELDDDAELDDELELELDDELELDEVELDDDADDEVVLAPVVALFAGEIDTYETTVDTVDTDDTDETAVVEEAPVAESRASVDDLFARLRAARADAVVERARAATPPPHAVQSDVETVAPAAAADPAAADPAAVDPAATPPAATIVPSVFQPSPEAPAASDDLDDDSPFGRRDAAITPLIVAAARKLKRVLADEQNDVLHALRRPDAAHSLHALVPAAGEHVERYANAVIEELRHAALAGAASLDQREVGAHERDIARADALQPALEAIADVMVHPLRERLDRAVADAEGDAAELTDHVRGIYREWKTQRIDEHVDDIVR
ncbi:MAG TPA: hypothetical protein DCR14_17375, partial [Acidimicrobiaceae bacterium]|nr:hypothetical protein [Acidimicrobiaceae bacterium]